MNAAPSINEHGTASVKIAPFCTRVEQFIILRWAYLVRFFKIQSHVPTLFYLLVATEILNNLLACKHHHEHHTITITPCMCICGTCLFIFNFFSLVVVVFYSLLSLVVFGLAL